MTLKELIEKRNAAADAITELRDKLTDESRNASQEEQDNFSRASEDYDSLSKQIEIHERAASVARATAQAAAPTSEERQESRALKAWVRGAQGDVLSEEDERVMRSAGFGPQAIELKLRRDPITTEAEKRSVLAGVQQRAMSTTTDSEGGYTVLTDLADFIDVAMLDFGGPRRVSTILRTGKGNPLEFPTVNDTSNTGSIEGENDALATTDVTFGQMVLNSYKISSDFVKVPYELLEDSEFNMAQFLGTLLGERIARNASALYTTGTGSSQPNGAVTASTLGVTAASATAITADELIDLQFSVDAAYARNGSWMLNRSTLKLIRKLKDGNGQYLWMPGINNGVPGSILGDPYVENSDMPAATTGLKSVLFGDFSKFYIRDVGSIRLRRLTERFADNDQEGFVALMRTDSDLLDAGTNPIKHLIQA
jgi:HK97 family phage major capsid protein